MCCSTLLGLQSRFGDELLIILVNYALYGTEVLQEMRAVFFSDNQLLGGDF